MRINVKDVKYKEELNMIEENELFEAAVEAAKNHYDFEDVVTNIFECYGSYTACIYYLIDEFLQSNSGDTSQDTSLYEAFSYRLKDDMEHDVIRPALEKECKDLDDEDLEGESLDEFLDEFLHDNMGEIFEQIYDDCIIPAIQSIISDDKDEIIEEVVENIELVKNNGVYDVAKFMRFLCR